MRMITPRIQPLADDQLDADAKTLLEPIAKGGRVLNIFRTLANHSALARRWMVFANHILGKSTLPVKERELVILRIGYLCQSGYEWGQHVVIARNAGMTEEEILASKSGPQTPGLSPATAGHRRTAPGRPHQRRHLAGTDRAPESAADDGFGFHRGPVQPGLHGPEQFWGAVG